MPSFKRWKDRTIGKILGKIHQHDDYTIMAVNLGYRNSVVSTFSTPWLIRAIQYYIIYNYRYRDCDIYLRHNRYPKV